jgi:hypothetical protein
MAAVVREAVHKPARKAKRRRIVEQAATDGKSLPTGTLFPVILCDCPWRYDFAETESRAIENQYGTNA